MKHVLLFAFLSCNILSLAHAQRGRVQIQDGTLVTDRGTLLRGAFVALDSYWYQMPTREQVIAIKDLGLNCIHVYAENYWDDYGGDPGYSIENIDSLASWTSQDSLYLIITFAGLDINNDTNVEYIKECWQIYSERYKDKTHIIFEIFNEPDDVPFKTATISLEKELYQIIRSYAPETHIQFFSPPKFFSYQEFLEDIDSLGDGINWNNSSIAVHAYQYPAQDYIEPIRKIKEAGYAITVTEFHSFMNEYANMALSRVFEQEHVSYIHFIDLYKVAEYPEVFKSRIESNDVRWTPDFCTWPVSITEINYQNPYHYWPAIFYDEGSGWMNDFTEDFIYGISENDYIAYYYLNFETAPASFEAMCSSDHGSGRIEIHLDSINGPKVGVCPVSNTGSLDTYHNFSCNITTPFTGVHKIYLVFKGTAPDWRGIFNLKGWYFIKPAELAPQNPYYDEPTIIPGKIEAEEYDIGGQTISFLDTDTINEGYVFREVGVDIDTTMDGGYAIGWTKICEWLEYTISCERDTVMDIQLRAACWDSGNKFNIKLDNKKLTTVYLDSVGSYYDWNIITIENIEIPAGENQILRIELLRGNFNLDWMNFVAKDISGFDDKDIKNQFVIYPNPAKEQITVKTAEKTFLVIYNIYGQVMIQKELAEHENRIAVNGLFPGSYIVIISNNTTTCSQVLIVE